MEQPTLGTDRFTKDPPVPRPRCSIGGARGCLSSGGEAGFGPGAGCACSFGPGGGCAGGPSAITGKYMGKP